MGLINRPGSFLFLPRKRTEQREFMGISARTSKATIVLWSEVRDGMRAKHSLNVCYLDSL